MKKITIKKIIGEFEYRYQRKNPALLESIRKLLATSEGLLLIAGQSEWLEDRLNEK